MNYLAHAVLGGLDPDVALGNFIADAVKGSAFPGLSPAVVLGVKLHRAIDSFADDHPASVASRALLRPRLGRMSGVALDLLQDHFLAREFDRFVDFPGGLAAFAQELESVLEGQIQAMPERSARFFSALRRESWLTGYSDPHTMRGVCASMDRRIPWPTNLVETLDVIEDAEMERLLVGQFESMWTDMQVHVAPLAGRSWARSRRM